MTAYKKFKDGSLSVWNQLDQISQTDAEKIAAVCAFMVTILFMVVTSGIWNLVGMALLSVAVYFGIRQIITKDHEEDDNE